MAAGTLVPFMTEIGLPGDTFDIKLNCDIKTHPTIGPLFGSYKVQIDVFQCPVRLYQGQLHNNKLGIGMDMSKVKLPQLNLAADLLEINKVPDNQQINPSSIFSHLNIRGIAGGPGTGTVVRRKFNAVPYLAYWDIYKNYYANKQEGYGVVIHNPRSTSGTVASTITLQDAPAGAVNLQASGANLKIKYGTKIAINNVAGATNLDTNNVLLLGRYGNNKTAAQIFSNWVTTNVKNEGINILHPEDFEVIGWRMINGTDIVSEEPKLEQFPLANIDMCREAIMAHNGLTAFEINEGSWSPYNLPFQKSLTKGLYSKLSSQEGLAIKTYQSDLFNNWLSTEWMDGENGINAITAIDTTDGKFTIDTLNLSKKVYDMLNRIAVSGGTYDDWLDAVYTHERYQRAETPMYMGGLIKELIFQEVVSNAQSADGQPLGTLAGKGQMGKKHKGGHVTVKCDEPCYIMGIISLTPRVDYSQGNKWDVNLKTMDDFHKPALDEIGFQDLITDQMAWWDTYDTDNVITFQSAGKQPAWLNYMTNVNVVRGNFAEPANEMFMTLNRRYEIRPGTHNGIADLTTYIDPVKFNHIFAETARDAQNFWAQLGIDITARRKMSAKVMPNL